MAKAGCLVVMTVVLAATACSNKPREIAVPPAVKGTLNASGFRFSGDVTRKLGAAAKPQSSHLEGRYEAPDRTEASEGGGPSQYFIGNYWYVPSASGYTCHKARAASLPTIGVSLLRSAARAKPVRGSATEFSFHNRSTSLTAMVVGSFVESIMFRVTAAGGFVETGKITYSEVGTAGHVEPPVCS